MPSRSHDLDGNAALGRDPLSGQGPSHDENPLDLSPEFDDFLLACRLGDLRKCQQLITSGVNVNGKDSYDYTPLIIVRTLLLSLSPLLLPMTTSLTAPRPVSVATMSSSSCSWNQARILSSFFFLLLPGSPMVTDWASL